MSNRALLPVTAIVVALSSVSAHAGPAAGSCPHQGFGQSNLAKNPSFETVGKNGKMACWKLNDPLPAHSAAADWVMHSDNAGQQVCTALVQPSNVPNGVDPSKGNRMLHVKARGGESGVFQPLSGPPQRLMISAWVYVRKGQVVLQPHGSNVGPNSWSTKTGEWQQLRACTDGTVPTDTIVIYNQDPGGGDFFVDRVEAREQPVQP